MNMVCGCWGIAAPTTTSTSVDCFFSSTWINSLEQRKTDWTLRYWSYANAISIQSAYRISVVWTRQANIIINNNILVVQWAATASETTTTTTKALCHSNASPLRCVVLIGKLKTTDYVWKSAFCLLIYFLRSIWKGPSKTVFQAVGLQDVSDETWIWEKNIVWQATLPLASAFP